MEVSHLVIVEHLPYSSTVRYKYCKHRNYAVKSHLIDKFLQPEHPPTQEDRIKVVAHPPPRRQNQLFTIHG